jgi:hypothetical protein
VSTDTNKSKIADAVAAASEQLVAALKAGQTEVLKRYLEAMGKFRHYSFTNCMLIFCQRLVTYCYTSLESINIRVCGSPSSINGNAKRVHHTVVPHC